MLRRASEMTTEEIRAELKALGNRWDAFRASECEHGGSPGEWMYERLGELEHALKLRGEVP